MTLVYSTMLTTTLSCTAFGGNGAQLEFIWTSTVGGLDQDTQIETLNEDNSTTSTISTMILTVENIGRYICDVAYQSSPDDTDDLSATINISKINDLTVFYIIIHYNSSSCGRRSTRYHHRCWIREECHF